MTPEQLTQLIDTIQHGTYAIVGSIWALIVATSWRG